MTTPKATTSHLYKKSIRDQTSNYRSPFRRNLTQLTNNCDSSAHGSKPGLNEGMKFNADETLKRVSTYLTSRKFNAESSAKAVSRTVGMFIKTFGITAPDTAGLRRLAEIMDERGLENTTRRFYISAFQNWAEAMGRPVDIKSVFSRKPPLKENMIQTIPLEWIASIDQNCDNTRDSGTRSSSRDDVWRRQAEQKVP